ncbi:MAG: hypothetical protein QXJ07_05500 [Candidatus Bathyarchaeia archaeon]
MARKRTPYIEVKRELVNIDTHEGCGGILFIFRIEQLDLSTFVGGREIRKIRKAVEEGLNLDRLMEFEEIGLDTFHYSECEKCGSTWSSPAGGGR